jgi:hypothetical protein
LGVDQRVQDGVDFACDARRVEHRADPAPLRLERAEAGDVFRGRGFLRASRELDQLRVPFVGGIVERDGKPPDVLVEVAWVVLTRRLERCDELGDRPTVQNRGEVAGLVSRARGCPLQVAVDDSPRIVEVGGGEILAAAGVEDAVRDGWKVHRRAAAEIDSPKQAGRAAVVVLLPAGLGPAPPVGKSRVRGPGVNRSRREGACHPS